jgi:hypothetical protein
VINQSRQQEETPVASRHRHRPAVVRQSRRASRGNHRCSSDPADAPFMPRKKKPDPLAESKPSRRAERIEILCFPEEKAQILRRAGNVPLGRWARIQLQGKRPSTSDAVPFSRMLGFAETIERLALEGNLDAILKASRSVQQHLRRAKS